MDADEQPAARAALPRRAVRAVARPVTDPMNHRFNRLEQQLDECTKLMLEVRDRVESDLASIVELTNELQRTLDALQREHDASTR